MQVVRDALVANFVPSDHPEDFTGFMKAFWDKHGELIATGGDRENHIRSTYLHEDPRRLGGRAVGLPGQSGSNNHGERKNLSIKDSWKVITNNIRLSERENPIFILAACAIDLRLTNDLEASFLVKPVRDTADYDLLRHTNHQAVNGFNTNCLDLHYMVCTDSSDPNNKKHLNHSECVGNPAASFTANLPTASQVYSTVRNVEKTGPDKSGMTEL